MAVSFVTSARSKALFEGIVSVPFDASLDETHNFSSKVTSNPVESGAEITDHISLEPKRLSITGMVSDAPIQIFSGIQERLGLVSGGGSRSKTALENLETLYNNRQPFDVVTGLRVYPNMVIQRLSIPRSRTTGQALRFTVDLVEVQFAEFAETALPAEKLERDINGSSKQAQGKQDVGKQPTLSPTAAEKGAGSILYQLFKDSGLI